MRGVYFLTKFRTCFWGQCPSIFFANHYILSYNYIDYKPVWVSSEGGGGARLDPLPTGLLSQNSILGKIGGGEAPQIRQKFNQLGFV